MMLSKDEYIEQLHEQRRELLSLLRECKDAIMWMSGSSDFSPEGQAHQGWLKTRPILDKIEAAIARASRA